VEEIGAEACAPVWRRDDETGQAYALKLTAAGTKAIGIDEGAKSENAHNETGALKNRDQVRLSSKAEAREASDAKLQHFRIMKQAGVAGVLLDEV
jgi:hypothetical protein